MSIKPATTNTNKNMFMHKIVWGKQPQGDDELRPFFQFHTRERDIREENDIAGLWVSQKSENRRSMKG